MRVLIDECLPKRLAARLKGHDARTVPEAGWAGKTNGALLRLADGVFDVLVTIDKNLVQPEKLKGCKIAVIVLVAWSNRLEHVLPLVSALLEAIRSAQPGAMMRVGST